jgi:hypothetical protein
VHKHVHGTGAKTGRMPHVQRSCFPAACCLRMTGHADKRMVARPPAAVLFNISSLPQT